MNRVRLHIRPAPIVAGAAEENQIMTAVTACAPYRPVREDVEQGRDDPVVIDLVTRARGGDIRAWDALVERFAPVIWSICRQHRLGRADADDVGQNVWLRLVTHLDSLRDPAALAGWIATTTRRECGKACRAARRAQAATWEADPGDVPDTAAESAESRLLAAERRAALLQAFASLSSGGQQLLAILTEDPPVPYAQISARLGIPAGSIGPTRRRCLQKLRHHPAGVRAPRAGSTRTARSRLPARRREPGG